MEISMDIFLYYLKEAYIKISMEISMEIMLVIFFCKNYFEN